MLWVPPSANLTCMTRHSTTTVAILGINLLAARALALLLEGVEYSVRVIKEPVAGKPGDLLEGVHLVLMLPPTDGGRREAFLNLMSNTPETSSIPVLMLGTETEGAHRGQVRHVAWPCLTETLRREIETALRAVQTVEEGKLTFPDVSYIPPVCPAPLA